MADPNFEYENQQPPQMSQGLQYGHQFGPGTVPNGQYSSQVPGHHNLPGNSSGVKQPQELQRNSVPMGGLPNASGSSNFNWNNQQNQGNPLMAHPQSNLPPSSLAATLPSQPYMPSLPNSGVFRQGKPLDSPLQPLTNGVQQTGPVRMTNPPTPRYPVYHNQYGQQSDNFGSSAAQSPSDMTRQLPQTLPLPGQLGPRSIAPPVSAGVCTPSPVASEPASAKSSRNPSPVPSQRYDAMEGQFYNSINNGGPSKHIGHPPLTSPISSQWNTNSPVMTSSSQATAPMTNYQPSRPPLPPTSNSYQDGSSIGAPRHRMPNPAFPNPQTRDQVLVRHPMMPNTTNQGPINQWNSHPPPPQFNAPGPAPPSTMPNAHRLSQQFGNLSFQNQESIDLLQTRNILPSTPVEPPRIILSTHDTKTNNCSPDLFRCTLTKIPESQSILHKSRLPLGVLIHPFKDLTQLAVVQCNVIVRCRSCRTYINPFVNFLDQRRWKCNLCFRVNELQEEFQFDPITKSYGDPTRRPEIRSATIEFIAPSEYMLRPPQPAVYLFILDVSFSAVETGYLRSFCEVLLENLDKLPGDSRTQIGFITFDSSIHFYNLGEGLSQPQMMVVSDIQDIFLPCPDNLLVNLHENIELVRDLLAQLPIQFMENHCPDNALGTALEAGFKLVSGTGGRVTVMQASLPNIGPGALKPREDPNLRAGKEVPNLGPANDYYKKLSLNCSSQQVAVDLFLLSSQYCDIATLSCISKYSGGSTHYYPGFHGQLNPRVTDKFEHDFKRYLTRKIGLEAVMRIRCTKGLSIHTFHGNFFVRSTDLLSLPNINPDSGFGMQLSIEESLTDCDSACFQAALLYTSCKGERRIRVHTLCLPVTASVHEVINGADQQAIVGLLTKMAVDRSLSSSMSDARDALINACVDAIAAYKVVNGGSQPGLVVPSSLKLLPLYILAILKHVCFRLGTSTKLDERVYAMNQMKTLPLTGLMPYIYPMMYPVHNLDDKNCIIQKDISIPQPIILPLTSEKFERQGVFLLDAGEKMFLYVCQGVSQRFCQNVFNVSCFDAIPENMLELPELETPESERLITFINYLQSNRPFYATLFILKSDSKSKNEFIQLLVEDRTESSYSYYEFLKHLQQLMTK